MTNISSSSKKPILLSINNSLPSANLHIGNLEDDENRGAAIGTRSLEYRMWVMSQCPEMVEEYLQCGKDTAYDVVHILATLDLKDTNQDVDHGKIAAIIRYKTPYIIKVREPFTLSFDLRHDVNLPCVLGLHTL